VHAADIQDRDGGALVMTTMFGLYPFLLKLYADGGYQGPVFRRAVRKIMARVNVEIVKRSDHAKGFVVLPKRWVVERTFAWLGRCRRLAKDWDLSVDVVQRQPPAAPTTRFFFANCGGRRRRCSLRMDLGLVGRAAVAATSYGVDA
jgi:transposase